MVAFLLFVSVTFSSCLLNKIYKTKNISHRFWRKKMKLCFYVNVMKWITRQVNLAKTRWDLLFYRSISISDLASSFPYGLQFSQFHVVSWKILKNYLLVPIQRGLVPRCTESPGSSPKKVSLNPHYLPLDCILEWILELRNGTVCSLPCTVRFPSDM